MGIRWNPVVKALAWAALASPAMPLPAAEPLPLLLAETEQGQADVALYLVSEKLDGVRAYWDGQALRTRNGHPIHAPAWFVAPLPPQPLDARLRLRQVPGRTVAVIRYRGTWSTENMIEKREVLLSALRTNAKWKVRGAPVWSRFDPPFMPWFLRRNEVQVEVSQ
mgnify:CR=1 FL=1